MKKVKNYKSVYIKTNIYEAKVKQLPNVTVIVSEFPEEILIGKFFIPLTSAKDFKVWSAAIKARAKHDLNITYDHYIGGSILND